MVAVMGFVLTAAIAFLIGYFVAKPPSLRDIKDTTAELAQATVDSEVLPVKGSPSKGDQAAPVTMVVFGDFQCPASRGASTVILDKAMKDFGSKQVRIVWKHLPLVGIHKDARLAAQATWAAAQQGKFWEYHDKIFDAFPSKDDANPDFLKEEQLVKYASELGLDVERFKTELKSPEAVAAVDADLELARSLGLESTPSIYVNGRTVDFAGGVRYEPVEKVVKEELARADELLKTPNAYYAYSVWLNRSQPDGIKTESTMVAKADTMDTAGEGAAGARNLPDRRAGRGADARPAAPEKAAPARQLPPGNAMGPDVATLPRKGSPNAKVTMLEFSEFQCPYCSKVNPTIKDLLNAYPNDLQIAFVHMPLDFHKDAPLAAEAAMAAHEQGKFWEYHDLLFANQKALKRPDLERFAEQVGLDMGKFRAALDSGKYTKAVDQNTADARAMGMSGTPSFAINGRKFVGAQPLDNFKKVIDEELARANKVAQEKGLSGDALYKELVRTAPKEQPKPKPAAAADSKRIYVTPGDAPVLGDANAPVAITIFTDFQCPYCSKAATTLHQLVKNNPGKVKLVFKHFPLDFHKDAPLAHRASWAAHQQGRFWEYHDLVFQNQKALQRENLLTYAQQLNLDVNKFTADLDSAASESKLNADKAEGSKAQVAGTPHFFINGTRFSGAQPLESFQAAVDRELKVAEKYTAKGIAVDKLYETIVKEENLAGPPPVKVAVGASPSKGPENAPVTIFEFSEFQCPYCSKVVPTIDELAKAYPTQVRIVFKHFPLGFHADAQLASEASLAAHEQGKFWEYHDLLFANQKAIKRPDLERYAEQLGLNMEKFRAALDSGKFKKQIEEDMAAATSAGISGTPSFLINGKKFVGAQPLDAFKAEVDAALAAK
jgi:protein-disulfide isomerase